MAWHSCLRDHAGDREVGGAHRRPQAPSDAFWTLASMLDVVRLAKEEVRRSGAKLRHLVWPCEEENVAALRAVIELALTRLGSNCGARLRLSMEQLRTQCLVLVHRRWGVVGRGLVKRHKGSIRVGSGREQDSLAGAVRLATVYRDVMESGYELFSGVPGVVAQVRASLGAASVGIRADTDTRQTDNGAVTEFVLEFGVDRGPLRLSR